VTVHVGFSQVPGVTGISPCRLISEGALGNADGEFATSLQYSI
jgi:hypothetical protein